MDQCVPHLLSRQSIFTKHASTYKEKQNKIDLKKGMLMLAREKLKSISLLFPSYFACVLKTFPFFTKLCSPQEQIKNRLKTYRWCFELNLMSHVRKHNAEKAGTYSLKND